ncbi:hypothetical protein RN001_002869 [Aquatica leii]|uniref:Uncharacterized protein n=1 Tax=Aquatica leii TaxID=1421715 RepID=A0AAN7PHS9_9COLE|nr:hypothetical protein RN001_002869 [Aquatica leii]
MEKGEAAQFKGKAFNEIHINLEEDLMMEGEEGKRSNSSPSVSEIPETIEPSLSTKNYIVTKKKRSLIKWTSEQKNIVKNFFAYHIKNKRPPKKNECEELKSQYSEVLKNKDWLKIKVFIQNEYQKRK